MCHVPIMRLSDLVDDHRALADMVRYGHMVPACLGGRGASQACREPGGAKMRASRASARDGDGPPGDRWCCRVTPPRRGQSCARCAITRLTAWRVGGVESKTAHGHDAVAGRILTEADTQAPWWRWRHACVEPHAGPQSPCLCVCGFWSTHPTGTAKTAHGVTTVSLPERLRRRALTRRQEVRRVDGTRQRADRTRTGHADHTRLDWVTALAQHLCDVHVFVFVFARSNARGELRATGTGLRVPTDARCGPSAPVRC